MRKKYTNVRKMWADMGYQGKELKDYVKIEHNIDIEIVKRPPCRFWVHKDTPPELLPKVEQDLKYSREVSDQENDIQNNNQQPSNPSDAAPRSEKRNKVLVVAASALAIAGVISGIAIAVHLEMLAVGIAVGAICCLVAAAIIYCCNQPSKSFENSNFQGFSEKVPQTTL
ncbi:transposase [Trichonephila clavata]|uniref:Transposase n=1 Tax=Trichonephila clavata TaxID=2740835 RepID=A0A8X6J7Y2_TRICU|nr:transposase [Trichonephila clavata]